jgi:transposase InsO family protein
LDGIGGPRISVARLMAARRVLKSPYLEGRQSAPLESIGAFGWRIADTERLRKVCDEVDDSFRIVGWMIAARDSAELAEQFIAETVHKERIPPGTLTLHADRGTSMRSKPVAALLVDLDVIKTHSRPHVSDDNPYSEAQFKTLKYRPDFPERFASIEHARAHCQVFFRWYNTVHRHSGIAMMTPYTVHHGHDR